MTMTDLDTVYISPYEIRRPRGRPKKDAPSVPKPPTPASSRGPGRPRREVPLTPEEIAERRRRYKNHELKQEYERLYQQCYYQRPEVKKHKAEYKRNKRSAEREARITNT